jgi:hypothetical protein
VADTGGSTTVPVPVSATGAPLAVTVTITSGSQSCLLYWPGQGCAWPGEWSPDLDAELRSPTGSVVATSECALSGWLCTPVGRQETLLVAAPVVGTYSLRVFAWNGGPGGAFAADVSAGPVTEGGAVEPAPNQPPSVDAGADRTVLVRNTRPVKVTLSGTASDADGTVVSVRWSRNGDLLSAGYSVTTSLGVGDYDFDFAATDDDGVSATDSVHVRVQRR